MLDDKAVLIKTAYSYYQKGDWDRAIEEYHKLADLDPKDLNVHNMMADIYAKKGDAKEAVQQYDLVAQGYDQKNQVDKVLQVYKRILKLTPNDPQILNAVKNLIDKYLAKAGQLEPQEPAKAMEIYRSILKVEPDRLDANMALARQLVKQNQKFEAVEVLLGLAASLDPTTQTGKLVEVLQSVVEWDPVNIPAREKLVDLLIAAKQTADAVKSIRDLIEIHLSKNELAKAEETAQKAIQLGDQETYYHLGVIYFNLQKYNDSRLAFEKFLLQQPSHVGALKYLALAYLRLGQQDGAVKVYLKILDVYFNENLLDEAREVRQTILEIDPNNADVQRYALEATAPAAEETAGGGSASTPEETARVEVEQQLQALLIQAQAYVDKGLYEQAIDIYLDMLKQFPQMPDIRLRLQQVYALMARGAQPAQPSAEQVKAELERELKEQMRREMGERQKEMEQRLLEQQSQRTKEEELKAQVSRQFEEQQRMLVLEKQRLEQEKEESLKQLRAEMEQSKSEMERRLREQIEREMREKQEKEVQRQAQVVEAIQKEEEERRKYEQQKKEQEAAKARVNQEIHQGMEKLRLEKERELKAAASAPVPAAKARDPVLDPPSEELDSKDSLEDPFVRQTLADIYAKQGLYVEALKIYEKILSEDPNNEDVKEKLRGILKMKGI